MLIFHLQAKQQYDTNETSIEDTITEDQEVLMAQDVHAGDALYRIWKKLLNKLWKFNMNIWCCVCCFWFLKLSLSLLTSVIIIR